LIFPAKAVNLFAFLMILSPFLKVRPDYSGMLIRNHKMRLHRIKETHLTIEAINKLNSDVVIVAGWRLPQLLYSLGE